jgi:uncharacterized membrane protein YphA (DoxX/SURF4 family)
MVCCAGKLSRRRQSADVVFLIGRILFALIFVNCGVNAYLLGYQGVQYARSYDVPLFGRW